MELINMGGIFLSIRRRTESKRSFFSPGRNPFSPPSLVNFSGVEVGWARQIFGSIMIPRFLCNNQKSLSIDNRCSQFVIENLSFLK